MAPNKDNTGSNGTSTVVDVFLNTVNETRWHLHDAQLASESLVPLQARWVLLQWTRGFQLQRPRSEVQMFDSGAAAVCESDIMLHSERPHGFVSVPAYSPTRVVCLSRFHRPVKRSDDDERNGSAKGYLKKKKGFFAWFIVLRISSSSFQDHGWGVGGFLDVMKLQFCVGILVFLQEAVN